MSRMPDGMDASGRRPRARRPIAAALVVACASAAGCSLHDNARLGDGGDALDFDLGGIAFHLSSGAARTPNGVLTFYLTDQPEACAAVTQAPAGTATFFVVAVAPRDDGRTSAAVTTMHASPGPGEAVGRITRQTGGVENARFEAAGGALSWHADGGSQIIDALDVGFTGISDRLTTGDLTLAPCN